MAQNPSPSLTEHVPPGAAGDDEIDAVAAAADNRDRAGLAVLRALAASDSAASHGRTIREVALVTSLAGSFALCGMAAGVMLIGIRHGVLTGIAVALAAWVLLPRAVTRFQHTAWRHPRPAARRMARVAEEVLWLAAAGALAAVTWETSTIVAQLFACATVCELFFRYGWRRLGITAVVDRCAGRS